MKSTLRSFDIAHLAHVELLTPRPVESLHFFVDVMGMTESGRRGESVYLRGWDDYEHHTLKLTASKVAGMGHFAFRATSPEALQHRVGIIEQAGYGKGWTDGDLGHGPAYAFTTSDGHHMEIYYETEWYRPPPELTPSMTTGCDYGNMTTVMKAAANTISKSQFKTRALEYFRRVEKTHKPLIITDRGRAVLKIVPFSDDPQEVLEKLRDSVVRYDTPTQPVGERDWEALR